MGMTDMTLQDKEKEINQINKKLAVMGGKELLIVHTTIMALYNRQQLDQYEQLSQQDAGMPELVAE